MQDTFQRQINYLRIAITDRCNLRCRYCMPATGVPLKGHEDILRLEEIATLARVAAGTGISRIRLTGGEPLVRKNVVTLVRELAAIPGLEEISLTTNGIFLGALAFSLKEAGLKRVNISLDTLKKDRYRYITRRGNITSVWQGIRAALAAGLTPVKLNVVITRALTTMRSWILPGWPGKNPCISVLSSSCPLVRRPPPVPLMCRRRRLRAGSAGFTPWNPSRTWQPTGRQPISGWSAAGEVWDLSPPCPITSVPAVTACA